ncbi:MAG: NAD(P)-dependent oxidoreductase [Meiothermus sp.]|nr:NAD(P)-dependent oxidoreductase [Meiothermus sp.]
MLTGAGGFVGRALAGHLAEAGYRVEACDLRGAPRAVDVLDREALLEAALEARPQTFVHAAALTSGEDLRVIEVNVRGTLNALEAARSAGVQHFILFSSCGVYAPQAGPISEEGVTTTAHAYGLSKLLAEQICSVGGPPDMTIWLLRIGAVYGPGERPSSTRVRASLVYEIGQAIRTRTPARLSRAPADVHNWLHTRDLARLLETIIRHPADGQTRLFNVAGPSVAVADLVQTFQKIRPALDLGRLLEFNPSPPPRHGAVDSSKLTLELNFSPAVPLEEGLEDYLSPSPQPQEEIAKS